MQVHVLAERRLHPERVDDYLAACDEINTIWQAHGFTFSRLLAFADDDPLRLLRIDGWPDVESHHAAHAITPQPLLERSWQAISEKLDDGRWYEPVRVVGAFAQPGDCLVVGRYRVLPEEIDAARDWAYRVQDTVVALPGVEGHRLMMLDGRPDQFLVWADYRDEESKQRALAAVRTVPGEIERRDFRRFVGRRHPLSVG